MSDAVPLRVQLLADRPGIAALEEAARAASVTTEASDPPSSDQRFGLVEVAAVIAIVHTGAQIAELLAKAFSTMRGSRKVTVRTPKGSVTIEGDQAADIANILHQIQAAGIV